MKSNSWFSKAVFAFFLVSSVPLQAQYGYDSAYFLFPIRPGERNYLAGTMGEIRGTHFHAGIDIRTNGVEGLPVYAAAEGYISRIKITTTGYGYALYLTHPNGLTTVYGHLKSYAAPIADWVRQQQYDKESFEVDLFPARNQFEFMKGDVIAASGNTGGSSGPHLHFEIRDADQKVLDPMRFHFAELVDETPPLIRKIAFTTLALGARINGQFGRFEFDVTQDGEQYVIHTPLSMKGAIGVEMYAYDRFDGTWSKNGIPCIEVMLDDQKVFSQTITKLSFDEMRNVAVHMNYAEYVSSGQKFNRLWVEDGNWLKIYEANNTQGIIKFADSLDHTLEVRTWDVDNNYAYFRTKILSQAEPSPTPIKSLSRLRKEGYEITGNVMELMNPNAVSQQHIVLYTQGNRYEIPPSYRLATNDFYLWDLRNGLPDSVDLCGSIKKFNFKAAVSPHHEFSYFDSSVQIDFNRYSLFDTLYLKVKEAKVKNNLEIFTLDNTLDPLRRSAKVTLKPAKTYDRSRAAVYTYATNGALGYVGGAWQNDGISFLTTSFNTYTIAADTVPPVVKAAVINSKECRLTIEDSMSGIKSWTATVNGKWVLMNYEYKKKVLWTEKLDPKIPLAGEFVLKVTDKAGNETVYKTKL